MIRPYHPTDWEAICQIHDQARVYELQSSVGLEAYLSLEETYQNEELFEGELWVYEKDQVVIGFMAIHENELSWLYVLPPFHQQGIGRSLLRKAIEICKGNITTEVLIGNEPALKLYLSEGFEIIEYTKGKLAGNENHYAEALYLKRKKCI